jgi:hypothetical protein
MPKIESFLSKYAGAHDELVENLLRPVIAAIRDGDADGNRRAARGGHDAIDPVRSYGFAGN